jgi:hypothetical protein
MSTCRFTRYQMNTHVKHSIRYARYTISSFVVFSGVHILQLSEQLSSKTNGSHVDRFTDLTNVFEEENAALRSLIADINIRKNNGTLIQCLANVFQCERQRRLKQIHSYADRHRIEHDIEHMCEYQRNALDKLLANDRCLLMEQLQHTNNELEQLKGQFNRLKNQQQSSTTIRTQDLNRFYIKYLRSEAHRKALIYQKRYLTIILTGYQDTETLALKQIRCLTDVTRTNSLPLTSTFFNMKSRSYHRHDMNNYRFRCYVRLVIACIRLRWLARKWTHKLASFR